MGIGVPIFTSVTADLLEGRKKEEEENEEDAEMEEEGEVPLRPSSESRG